MSTTQRTAEIRGRLLVAQHNEITGLIAALNLFIGYAIRETLGVDA
jgi:hypothetical protein